jgi:flagellar M-ring protein FliF
MAAALALLYLRVLKPLMKKLSEAARMPPPSQNMHLQHAQAALPGHRNYQDNLTRAQQLANQDPRVVANIVKTWVGSNE